MSTVTSTFSEFNEYLAKDQDVREEIRTTVRCLEQTAREIMTTVQAVHQPAGLKDVAGTCQKARGMFECVRSCYGKLKEKFPADQYYRFHDHWRFVSQRLVFLSALIVYLESNKLISREEVAQMLGIAVKREDGFHIDLDDYLQGLLTMANELSRLAVNSVTAGDYNRPLQISNFMGELDAGFRLLNLKNDNLRKRFDGLKYDIKKVEEVVYDITIRGLKPTEAAKADQAEGGQ